MSAFCVIAVICGIAVVFRPGCFTLLSGALQDLLLNEAQRISAQRIERRKKKKNLSLRIHFQVVKFEDRISCLSQPFFDRSSGEWSFLGALYGLPAY